jgi:hypothetical protein
MGNVINSCPNNKILLSSIKLKDPTKSCLNCSKTPGYKLNQTSDECICDTGYINGNINNLTGCYPLICKQTGYTGNISTTDFITYVPLPNDSFTSSTTTKNGNSGYEISQSTYIYNSSDYIGFRAFNDDNSIWHSNDGVYIFNGNYISDKKTNIDGSLIAGEWIQIKFPYKITVNSFSILSRSSPELPVYFYFLGSNDSILWNNIGFYYTGSGDFDNFKSPYINSNNMSYMYYRFVITQTRRSGKALLTKIFLYGGIQKCVCAPDYYLPSGSSITYDNGILNGCIAKPSYITFYDAKENTQQFLYDKTTNNTFYFYRTTSETCATDPTKNNIKIIPIGFKTNFTISNIPNGGGILLSSNWLNVGSCIFTGVSYLDVKKISDNNYIFNTDLSTNYFINNFQNKLDFLTNQISY